MKNNLFKQAYLFIFFIILSLSGCGTAFVASKQDDLATQIDVWSAENEFGKAFSTLTYVKKSHPQYQQLQVRKKSLIVEAGEYEQRIDKQIKKYIKQKKWTHALDLLDQAKEKYPLDKSEKSHRLLAQTEKNLLQAQQILLTSINQKIMLKRSLWMIETRPIYAEKLSTDPRNEILKKHLKELNKETRVLAKKQTVLSQQALEKKHYITARTRITQAIALAPSKQREKILTQLKNRTEKDYRHNKQKKIKSQKELKNKQYNILLQDIEKSFSSGNFLNTRQLISQLDESNQKNIHLIQLKQELDRSIHYTIKQLMSQANQNYTDGQFHQAIDLWEQVLLYDPENILAKKNRQRAEQVIDKLSRLREKQNN